MRASRATLWCLLLSLIGIGLCGYLTFLHLGLMRGELLGGAACGGSATSPLNCHAVTSGRWGSVLGMPLALWGIVGYVGVFALSLLGRQSTQWATHTLTLLVLLSAAFVAVDAVLLGVMVIAIRYYCVFCLLTHLVNLSLLVVSARALGQPAGQVIGQSGAAVGALIPSSQRPAAGLFWGVIAVGLLGVFGVHLGTHFVIRGTVRGARQQIREFFSKQPRVSVDIADDPALGEPGAALRLVEFSDFLCPACQRASKLNRVILAGHRRDVVFVFKHYPLDLSCNERIGRMVHPGACQLAAASECAHQQGKFWPLHDLIFERGHDYPIARLEGDVQGLGVDMARFHACMDSGQGMQAVKRDIAEAVKVGVGSTPTYVLNGVTVTGGINPEAFEDFAAVLRENAN